MPLSPSSAHMPPVLTGPGGDFRTPWPPEAGSADRVLAPHGIKSRELKRIEGVLHEVIIGRAVSGRYGVWLRPVEVPHGA